MTEDNNFIRVAACVQTSENEEPRYLQGMCLISRNPVVHPGDGSASILLCATQMADGPIVQRVYAIGPPPKDRVCLFGHLKNVVVFATTGKCDLSRRFMFKITTFVKGTWSLPNGLAGGDLDGYAARSSVLVSEAAQRFQRHVCSHSIWRSPSSRTLRPCFVSVGTPLRARQTQHN